MTDYKKYINALRKCAKEHENDRTSTGHIIVSDLCRDTANLLESLEQESTDKENLVVEDCISRKQAMKACYQMAVRTGIEEMPYKYAETELAHLPSIQPKTGHWISKHIVDDCNGVVTWYECSECGRSVDAPITEEFMLKDYPYCHCGAKMVELQESEDKE